MDVTLRRAGKQAVDRRGRHGHRHERRRNVKRLFGEFVRIRNEKTHNILGSGLGLSIVKKLALLYGGDVHGGKPARTPAARSP